jgi:hypothetical protein
MKKIALLLSIVTLLVCGVSCNALNTGASLPIPFTNPSASVSLDIQATPLPPKFCIGLDVVGS